MARLEDVAYILDSQRVPITKADRVPGPYPYYGANGLQDKINNYIFDDELVLLAEDGGNFDVEDDRPIAYRVSGKCWVNNHAHVLKPKDGVDVDYLCCSLMNYDVSRIVNGATRKKLTQADMREMIIPLPDLPTQRRIAATLDKVSEGIELCRKMLGELEEVVKGRFVEMFGDMESNPKQWRKSTVGQECHYIKDGPHKSPPYVEDGISFISTRNVVNGDGIDWSTAKYISEADYLECIKKCKPERGNILYSKGGTTGIAKLVETEKRFANWVHVAVLKFGEQLDGKFFECMLNMDYCYQQSQQLTKGIANRDFVLSAIAQVKIIVPPINLQRQYAEFVRQTDKSKLSVQRQLSALETLKKSLMQEYFR